MIDIALVSYINTRPFMDGLGQVFQKNEARLHLMPPSACADFLAANNCQLALLPSGALPRFPKLSILPNYCIGADGPVESVFIFSQEPIHQLKNIVLDRHSNTSNGLARILVAHHWQQNIRFLETQEKNFQQIEGDTGGVVIGDHAIRIRDRFRYAYDLAEIWKQMTGLPFAFAVWAYLPGTLNTQQKEKLNQAFRIGTAGHQETAEKWAVPFDIPLDFAKHYLSNCIDYRFDAPKHHALKLYFKLLKRLPVLAVER